MADCDLEDCDLCSLGRWVWFSTLELEELTAALNIAEEEGLVLESIQVKLEEALSLPQTKKEATK